MPDGGWIPLWRKAFDCHLSPRKRRLPYTEFEAWLDLLCRAVQKHEGVTVKGVGMMPVKLEAGEILCSYRGLQKDWRWGSHHKVRRYCTALCRMEMIEITSHKPTRLKIVNAEIYGLVRPRKRDGDVPRSSHARPTLVPIQQGITSNKDKQSKQEHIRLFKEFWAIYPARSPKSNRKQAEKAWRARANRGVDIKEILIGVRNYAAYCENKGWAGTEFVKMASTFLGPAEHWKQFQEPVTEKRADNKINRTTEEYDDLPDWAKEKQDQGIPKTKGAGNESGDSV